MSKLELDIFKEICHNAINRSNKAHAHIITNAGYYNEDEKVILFTQHDIDNIAKLIAHDDIN